MDLARLRAYSIDPPPSLADLRPASSRLALRCVHPECDACAGFRGTQRTAFEATLGVAGVVVWDCGRPDHRRLAAEAGVDRLPSYVVLTPNAPPTILTPNLSSTQTHA